jgi:DNA-binding Xre family transcriptional regulator
MKVRTQLTELRTQHNNITQAELAEQTGISQQQLGELECGQASGIEFETLAKLCTFFHCTPNDLLTLEESDKAGSPTESIKRI